MKREPIDEKTATFWDHLGEMRSRIMKSLLFILLGWIVGYYLQPWVYNLLSKPLLKTGSDIKLVFSSFADPFMLQLKLGFVIGLILVSPLIIYQGWAFIAPAIEKQHRKLVYLITPLSIVLFAVGLFFGYLIMPSAFSWFLSYLSSYPDAVLYQNPQQYVMFVLKMLLAFGGAFQLPVALLFLAKAGLIDKQFMWRYWRQAVVGISIIAMVLTPSNDAISMLTMAVPMVLLYFLSIALVGWASRRRKDADVQNE